MTVDQLLQMRGPAAKKLFVEYVKEHYGIDLSSFQQQCQQNQAQQRPQMNQQMVQNRNQVTNQVTSTVQNSVSTVTAYVDTAKIGTYKQYIETKYGQKLASLTMDKIEQIIEKINSVEEKIINSSSYSDSVKKTYITVLEALKQILQEKLTSNSTSLIDNLLGE